MHGQERDGQQPQGHDQRLDRLHEAHAQVVREQGVHVARHVVGDPALLVAVAVEVRHRLPVGDGLALGPVVLPALLGVETPLRGGPGRQLEARSDVQDQDDDDGEGDVDVEQVRDVPERDDKIDEHRGRVEEDVEQVVQGVGVVDGPVDLARVLGMVEAHGEIHHVRECHGADGPVGALADEDRHEVPETAQTGGRGQKPEEEPQEDLRRRHATYEASAEMCTGETRTRYPAQD